MNCAGCRRELDVGDQYIEDSASGFMQAMGDTDREVDPVIDGLVADILGGAGGKIVYCEDCTQTGGDYLFETVYGDEDE